MDHIKEAFSKVKDDISSLKDELFSLKKGLIETRQSLLDICELIKAINLKADLKANSNPKPLNNSQEESKNQEFPEEYLDLTLQSQIESSTNQQTNKPTNQQTNQHINPTNQHINPTHSNIPTHNLPLYDLKSKNITISTGNQGVPTDKPTDKQTNQQTNQHIILPYQQAQIPQKIAKIDPALEVLNSLDTIKKEIRLKFKRLTEQEILVYSALYQLDEETHSCDYKSLSQKLTLSESSIRDYIGKLIKKGIPLEKTKINNKLVLLSIPSSFKKIVSLSTILQLREI